SGMGREHDAGQLLPEDVLPFKRDADRAPPQKRVVLVRIGKVGQTLVASDIESANVDGLAGKSLQDFAVDAGLGLTVGKCGARHVWKLGAVEPYPFGAMQV